MDYELFVALTCIGLSFLFSASETALTSLGRLEMQTLISRGGTSASLIRAWKKDPSRVLVTILVGNTIANVAGSSVLTLWAQRYYSDYVSLVMGIFTMVLLFFAEIIPKLIARRKAIRLSPFALRFLQFVDISIRPLILLVKFLSTAAVSLFGFSSFDIRRPVGEEEVSQTIEMATREGGIDKETGEVLSNLIDFPDRIARDVMTARARMKAVSVSWTQKELLEFFSEEGHSRYPVYRKDMDEIVGFVMVKDILNHIYKGAKGSWTRVIRKPYYVSEMGFLGDILRDMKRWGTHLAIVRNELGVVTGLVTLEDLIEEIVGEIRDEHDDPSEAGMESAMGGPTLVSGEMPIVDFNERFYCSLPMEASYSTLNGYLLYHAGGKMPLVGTIIVDEEMSFRIRSVSDSGIATVEVIELGRNNDDKSH